MARPSPKGGLTDRYTDRQRDRLTETQEAGEGEREITNVKAIWLAFNGDSNPGRELNAGDLNNKLSVPPPFNW